MLANLLDCAVGPRVSKEKGREPMNWKRILRGKINLEYCGWQKWTHVGMTTAWSGGLIYLNFSKLILIIDCRKNWVEDMMTGTAQ